MMSDDKLRLLSSVLSVGYVQICPIATELLPIN